MRAEFAIATAAQIAGLMAAHATDAPDFTTKLLGILAGTFLGALLSSVISPTATVKQRIRRGLISLSFGPIVSVVAVALKPKHTAFDPREWVFVVAGIASFLSWWLARKFDERGEALADSIADSIESKAGIKRRPKREHGRARVVLLVLIAGLALLSYVFRDLLGLLWAIATGWVGH